MNCLWRRLVIASSRPPDMFVIVGTTLLTVLFVWYVWIQMAQSFGPGQP
jgi:hypothetical protein